jgi:AraC family transcriptional regulator
LALPKKATLRAPQTAFLTGVVAKAYRERKAMPEEKSLAIDLSDVKARKYVLPKLPLLVSYKARWENLGLEYHIQPPYESPQHYATHYTIVIRLKHQPGLERRLGECYQIENSKPGDVVVMPPNLIHSCVSTTESEFIALTLNPQLVLNSVYESVNPDEIEIIPQFSKPDPLIYQIGLALKQALETDVADSRLYAESMATVLSIHLLRHYSTRSHAIDACSGGLPQHKLRHVIDFIVEHLAEDLSLSVIANQAGMSRYHFTRLFKQSTGLSPYQYVIQCRIEHAKILLCRGKMKISEVASLVGFADQSQFTRHFKRLLGITPKQLRKQ